MPIKLDGHMMQPNSPKGISHRSLQQVCDKPAENWYTSCPFRHQLVTIREHWVFLALRHMCIATEKLQQSTVMNTLVEYLSFGAISLPTHAFVLQLRTHFPSRMPFSVRKTGHIAHGRAVLQVDIRVMRSKWTHAQGIWVIKVCLSHYCR